MAVPFQYPAEAPGVTDRHLSLVPGIEHHEGEVSRDALDETMRLRDFAAEVDKIDGQELADVQNGVRDWLESSGLLRLPDDEEGRFRYYTEPSEALAGNKLLGLIDYLRDNHGDKINEIELEATRAFFDSAFALHNDRPEQGDTLADADGSFAFVVPARMARNHPEYGEEVEPLIPALRYVPNELRAQMLVGLPPFIIDTYKYDEFGKRGYLIFAAVTEDLVSDLPMMRALEAAQSNVNGAVDFAHRRFGVNVVGLGATLPALTRYGQKITNPNVVTTTGHGGTAVLVNKTVEVAAEKRDPNDELRIGILGLGSIGASMAHVIADNFPEASFQIYDPSTSKITRTQAEAEANGHRMEAAASDIELVEESDIVVSAIVGAIHLRELGITSMDGKVIVDDSQPGSFDPKEVADQGGHVLWVIGEDAAQKTVVRRGYDYATLCDPHTDVFGCEAEAASLARHWSELTEQGMPAADVRAEIERLALRGPVTAKSARAIGELFDRYGIIAAKPQAFGQYVQL